MPSISFEVKGSMTQPLHICVIGDGGDIHTQNRTLIFVERGHQVTLVTDRPGKLPGVQEIFIPLPEHPVLKNVGVLRFVRTLQQIDADVFMVHFPRRPTAWAAAIANVQPTVISVMGGDVNFADRDKPTSDFQQALTRAVLNNASYIVAKSNYLIGQLSKLGDYEDRVTRVIWGVDLNHWRQCDTSSLRQQLKLSPDAYVILSPKVLRPFYNIHMIIEAMPSVIRQHPGTQLLITERWADETYKTELTTRIAALGIQDHVRFIGEVTQNDLPLYYSLSDITVSLAPSDGLPQALFEAMACETPCLLGNLEQYREVVRHKDSAYFVEFDPESIANGINELLGNPQLRQTIARNGLKVVQEVADIHKEAERVEGIFHRVRAESRHRPNRIDYGLLWRFLGMGIQRAVQKISGKI